MLFAANFQIIQRPALWLAETRVAGDFNQLNGLDMPREVGLCPFDHSGAGNAIGSDNAQDSPNQCPTVEPAGNNPASNSNIKPLCKRDICLLIVVCLMFNTLAVVSESGPRDAAREACGLYKLCI